MSAAASRLQRRLVASAWLAAQAPALLPAWTLALVGAAWVVMISHGVRFGVHAHHAHLAPSAELFGWMAMIVAMMVPAAAGNLRDVAARSYRERRIRTQVVYLAVYLGAWLVFGLPLVALRGVPAAHDLRVAAVAFALAGVWAWTPWRQRFVQACHRRIPLEADGWSADRSVAAQALVASLPCVATCGAMMAGCLLAGHQGMVMAVGAIATWVEKLQFRPDPRVQIGAAGVLTMWCWFGA